MPVREAVKIHHGGKKGDLHTYRLVAAGKTTLPREGEPLVTETNVEFVYTQALLELSDAGMLIESTVLLALNKLPSGAVRLPTPPAARIRLRRSGASLEDGQVGSPVVFPEGPVGPGDSWDGLSSCALVVRGTEGDYVQSIAVPVRFTLRESELDDCAEIDVLAAEATLQADDGSQHVVSLQGRVDFSIASGCIERARQATVQCSPDGSRVDNSLTWERMDTIRSGET